MLVKLDKTGRDVPVPGMLDEHPDEIVPLSRTHADRPHRPGRHTVQDGAHPILHQHQATTQTRTRVPIPLVPRSPVHDRLRLPAVRGYAGDGGRGPYAPGVLIETERLLLRALVMDDLDEFATLHRDPEVVRFVRALDRGQAEERLRANEQEWAERGHGMLAVLDRSSGRLLGRVGLKYWPQFKETEAGWLLGRDAWGHGYATEAARACLESGFAMLPVPYITAMIQPANTRSTQVAQRLGFQPLREDVLLGDPVIVHAVNRESWASLKSIVGNPPG